MPPVVLAHALPDSIGAVPLTAVLTLAVAAFLTVGALGTKRAAAGAERRAAVDPVDLATVEPAVAATPQDDPPAIGQAVGVIALLVIAALAVMGPADASSNLTDQAVLSLLWGAVALSSAAVGGWWWRVDPVGGLARGAAAATGEPLDSGPSGAPRQVAAVGMVLGLVAWAWAQVLLTPSVAAFQAMLLGYVALHVAATLRFGSSWLRQAEALTVMSSTLGLMRIGGGGPVRRLSGVADTAHLRWVSACLIAWSATDLITETAWWHDRGAAWAGPVLLIGSVALLRWLMAAVGDRYRLGPAFVAVAAGWTAAHYISVLVIEGQGIPIWLSDPFGTGADLFGRRGDLIDLEPLPLGVMALLQTVPFVAGHLAAVVIAQRRAAERLASAGQVGTATFLTRALIGVLLVGGLYAQLGGV